MWLGTWNFSCAAERAAASSIDNSASTFDCVAGLLLIVFLADGGYGEMSDTCALHGFTLLHPGFTATSLILHPYATLLHSNFTPTSP